MRYDFLLFIGRVSPSCLPDLYIYEAPCAATVSYALFLFLQVGKRGIEPPSFIPLGNWFTVSRNTANRCRFPKTALRRLAIIFFVPCVALGIQNADYSQTIERMQANSIIWPLRQARIRTLHYRLQKRCGCWLRMIARLPLGNTLTDRFLYLQYPFCHCLTIWGNYIFDSSGTVG